METALEVINITKSYVKYKKELHRFLNWFGFCFTPLERVDVLKNISFEVKKGETVGIIGGNGAGKSTILKILSGTLKQTSGTFHIKGRVSAILELGMGFQYDLTGRQNCYLYAGLMGFDKKDIDSVIESIKDFSEIGDYFEQPIRVYSSGMQMRLAFSVATAFRPQLLIVDEALSVGDAYFQHKSFDRIRKFRKDGTTILFVSHDRAAIQSICDRAILLDRGRLIKDGDPESVLNYYNALIANKENSYLIQQEKNQNNTKTRSGNNKASLKGISIFNTEGKKIEYVKVGEVIELAVDVTINQHIKELVVGFVIRDRLGLDIFGTNSYHLDKIIENPNVGEEISFRFRFPANFGIGTYSITVAAHTGYDHIEENFFWEDNSMFFTVVNIDKPIFAGSSFINTELEISRHGIDCR